VFLFWESFAIASVLNLLGSHFGRRDHRIVHISGDANQVSRVHSAQVACFMV